MNDLRTSAQGEPAVVNIRTPRELDRICAADRKWTERVTLALESLEPMEQREWEQRINRHFRACGCGSAAAGLSLAFVIGAALAVINDDLLSRRPLLVTGLGLLALLVAAGLGKAFGLWVARIRLKSAVAALRRRLIPPEGFQGTRARG